MVENKLQTLLPDLNLNKEQVGTSKTLNLVAIRTKLK
jgi:hypothetical protein